MKLKTNQFIRQISQERSDFSLRDRMMPEGRYIFTLLACLGNMMCLLGRDSLRLAVLPMKEELNMTTEEVSHVLAGYNYGMTVTMVLGGRSDYLVLAQKYLPHFSFKRPPKFCCNLTQITPIFSLKPNFCAP